MAPFRTCHQALAAMADAAKEPPAAGVDPSSLLEQLDERQKHEAAAGPGAGYVSLAE